MKPIATVTEIEIQNGYNVIVSIERDNIIGKFRVCYNDETRKNSRHKDLKVKDIYYEGMHNIPNTDQKYLSYSINKYTDLLLFVERHKQWILERIESIK